MKKFCTFFVSLFCCLSMFAATETVYFVNADKWTGTIKAYAWEPQNANWPGVNATKETEKLADYDVYSYSAEAGKYANVIFNNGSKQTADLKWTAGKYYVRDGWYTKEEAIVKLGQPIEYESVYFVNVDGWKSVKIYTWSPELATWPGVDMKKETTTIGGKEVWSHTEMKGASFGGVIFNDGNGTQTADLTWNAGKYFVSDGWYTKEEAEAKLNGSVTPNPQGTFYITGTAELVGGNGWSAKEIKMTFNEATSTHTHTFKGLATGIEYKMKVTNGTWDKSWGFDAVKNAPAGVKADNDGNIVFNMAATSNVIVSFDGANITLQGNFGQGSVTPPGLPTVALAGEMNEWSTTANKFVPAKDSLTASVSVDLAAQTYQFKVVVDNTWQTNISATMTRTNCTDWEFSVMDGEETNAQMTADVAGQYTFVWTYVTNSLSVIYPNTSAVEDVEQQKKATKYIHNGQLYIIRNNQRYNIMGQIIK